MKYIFITFFIGFFWMSCSKSHQAINTSKAPIIKVIDTDFSKGQLNHVQDIQLDDLVKLHGHLCDGLIVGYLGLHEAFKELYPEGPVDRTNTRIISKSSPCLTDAAIYLTGGRYQYNSFYVDNSIDGIYYLQRLDHQKALSVSLKAGVKPEEIDSLGQLAIKERLNLEELNHLKQIEDEFSAVLLSTPAKELFDVEVITDFQWSPRPKHNYPKTDIINKNVME
ncbi:formylmethanofuran dehydrogenase subunit E family protein [Psychroflexus sp. CAK57W]|uniref:formylmethanofuran dehydrogenase subunit E family protein n=1 Tax=Psychroflexus curvus TaxID=2873595 RepID=UPI001CCDC9B6|nr:FmdE family protein [Psychroflexus curvus]MBZ9627738.1 formylmethanofuran dehydrogenase subunit E family protein [Psychroflexus curvus]MBZ9786226.1 formylmethanofuran dehydrogenase subunit E family protein [Psychroflexus curvus]